MRENPSLSYSYVRILPAQLSLTPLKTDRWQPLHPFLDSLSETKTRLRLPWQQWLNLGQNCDRYPTGNTRSRPLYTGGCSIADLGDGCVIPAIAGYSCTVFGFFNEKIEPPNLSHLLIDCHARQFQQWWQYPHGWDDQGTGPNYRSSKPKDEETWKFRDAKSLLSFVPQKNGNRIVRDCRAVPLPILERRTL